MRGPVVGLVLCAALAGAGCGGDALPAAAPRWEALDPATLARTEVAAREHLAGAVTGGRFYVLAGRAAGQGNFTVVEAFDPAAARWRRVPPMRKPRGGIAAATVRGRIVVVGGEETGGTIREVELYDPRARRWSRLADLPTPRHGLAAVARRGRVYAIEGGDSPGFAFTNAIEALTLPRR